MKSLFKSFVTSCLLFTSLNTMISKDRDTLELTGKEFVASSKLGELQLHHTSEGFSVVKDEITYPVQNAFIDKPLRGITRDQLSKLLGRGNDVRMLSQEEVAEMKLDESTTVVLEGAEAEEILEKLESSMSSNYIQITQTAEGEYLLHLKTRLLGAGPGLGWWSYLAARGIVYGISWSIQGTIALTISATCTPLAGIVATKAMAVAFAAPTEACAQWFGIAACVVVCTAPTP